MKADRERQRKSLWVLIVLAVVCVVVLIVSVVMLFKTQNALTDGDVNLVNSDSVADTTSLQTNSSDTNTAGTTAADSNNSVQTVGETTTASSSAAAVQTTVADSDLSSLSTSEIASIMTSAIAQVKSDAAFTGRKQQVISIELVDCSISSVTSLVNRIIQGLVDDKDETYSFSNGTATNTETGETTTTLDQIPPSDKQSYIDPAGLTSATAEKSGDNTVYTVKFVQEYTTLESPVPYYHAQAMDYLDLASVDVSPAKITQADMTYTGATIKVTVNSSGQIVGYYTYMPISGTGSGSLGLSVSGTIDGYLEENWTFTW
ncbi:MAG: hypothetical protein LUH40_05845 [Clostridiales bacterium]|nr:hypothetical protein [Clostridiales bacterium]